MIDLFDHLGRIAPDRIDPLEVETLPDDERAALMTCIQASRAAEDAEDRHSAARKLVTKLMNDYDVALLADHTANPAVNQIDALRAVIAAQRPGYRAEPEKINVETRKALSKCTADLAEARIEFVQSEIANRTLSKARGDAIVAYMAFRPKVTAESVHREMMAADNARKVERVQRGEPPMPVKAVPVYPSHLDQVMGAGKHVDRGSKRVVRQPR